MLLLGRLLVLLLVGAWSASVHARWELKLKLKGRENFQGEMFQRISPVNDRIVWAYTWQGGSFDPVFRTYRTENGGGGWTRRRIQGLRADLFPSEFVALDSNTALIAGTVGFTGIGPGILYRTTDGGGTWRQTFAHPGNCDFLIGMADSRHGLMAVESSFFDGRQPPRHELYATSDGGATWIRSWILKDPDSFIRALLTRDNETWLQAGGKLYYSEDFGRSWRAEKLPAGVVNSNGFTLLQMESRSYGVAVSGFADIYRKLPGEPEWRRIAPIRPLPGLVQNLVLDGNQCWLSMPLDDLKNYHSTDQCATFKPFAVDPASAFFHLQQAWHGRSLWGTTQKKVFVNRRLRKSRSSDIDPENPAD